MNATTVRKSNSNSQQQEAIDTTEGLVLIIAGPSSGKTHALVERIVHLIIDRNDTRDREKVDRYRRHLEVYAHIIEERHGPKRTCTTRA